ncbi:MAG: FHIPEP family type III secretion protein, partial [Burkholderiales bacterium]
SPILLHVAANLKNGAYVNTIKQAALTVQQEILVNLGVELPQITIRYDSSLENNHYQILIYEIPTATTIIYPQHILIVEQQLKQLEGIIPTQTIVSNNTSLGMAENGVWVPESNIDVCEKYNLSYLTIEDFITKHVTYVLRLHVSEFLGMQEVKNLLTKIDEYQDLITELLRMISLNKITEMLQRLIAEDISIRNFKVILDTMLEWAQREKETIIITEQIRSALGRYIAYKFSKGSYTIQCFLLDQDIEDMIRDAIRFNHNGSYLALDPQIAEKIINSTLELYQKSNGQALSVTPVIVTHQDIRRYVRSIIEKRLNFIHVLSFQELEGHVEFNGLGVIQLGGY